MDWNEAYRAWMEDPRVEEKDKDELRELAPAEREDRFRAELTFGTAGLRGILGMGTNRMNVYVVRRATQGLCAYLNDIPGAKARGVAVAYDSRHMSDTFAKEAALVLAGNGVKTYLFPTLHSVPQLSFAVRHLRCIAGIVITASHNPPEYNGYKVYWEDGGQIGPVQADAVFEQIQKTDAFGAVRMDEEEAKRQGILVMLDEKEDQAYVEAAYAQLPNAALLADAPVDVIYTPLHGSGLVPLKLLYKKAGFQRFTVVPAQAMPDGAFPTVKVPNPEDPTAYTLAFRLADQVKANLVLATDPDADRLGIAVRGRDGSFRILTGNQLGCLLLDYVLGSYQRAGKLPEKGIVIRSLVSTRMADAICAHYGVPIYTVPTGFRFLSARINECEKNGETFLFGFEESCGFLFGGGASLDKDGVSAALLVTEAAAYYARQNMTLADALDAMYLTYGDYRDKVVSFTLKGKTGMQRIENAMRALREDPPHTFAGKSILCMEDHRAGTRLNLETGSTEPLSCAPANMLRFLLGNGCVCARPSGTEPKFKIYLGAVDERRDKSKKVPLDTDAFFLEIQAFFEDLLNTGKNNSKKFQKRC